MSKQRAEKVRELSEEELLSRDNDLREEIFRARIKHATGQLDNPRKVRELRKDRARILTVMAERKRAGSS